MSARAKSRKAQEVAEVQDEEEEICVAYVLQSLFPRARFVFSFISETAACFVFSFACEVSFRVSRSARR